MKQHVEEELELRKYLLGELSQDDAVRVEARLFLENEYSQIFKAAEDDLVDDYVNGELSADEREKFEQRFLSDSAYDDDLHIARALKKYLAAETMSIAATEEKDTAATITRLSAAKRKFLPFNLPRPSLLKYAAVAASLLVLIGAWLVFRTSQRSLDSLPAQVRRQETPTQELTATPTPSRAYEVNHQPEKEHQQSSREIQPPTFNQQGSSRKQAASNSERAQRRRKSTEGRTESHAYAFLLTPGGLAREGDVSNEVHISSRRKEVVLELPLAGSRRYDYYEATLYNAIYAVDSPVQSWRALKPTPSSKRSSLALFDTLHVRVPVGLLSGENYYMKVRAISPQGQAVDVTSFYFRVVRKQAR